MNSSKMLLNEPEKYARSAIVRIQDQLLTAKGPNRVAKLQRKLKEWTTTLDVLLQESEKSAEK